MAEDIMDWSIDDHSSYSPLTLPLSPSPTHEVAYRKPDDPPLVSSPPSPSPTEPCSPPRSSCTPELSQLPKHQLTLNEARKSLAFALPRYHAFQGRFCQFTGALRNTQQKGRPRQPLSELEKVKHRRGSKKDMSDPDFVLNRKRLMTMWNSDWENKEDWDHWRKCEPKMTKLKRRFQLAEVDSSDTQVLKKRKKKPSRVESPKAVESVKIGWPHRAKKSAPLSTGVLESTIRSEVKRDIEGLGNISDLPLKQGNEDYNKKHTKLNLNSLRVHGSIPTFHSMHDRMNELRSTQAPTPERIHCKGGGAGLGEAMHKWHLKNKEAKAKTQQTEKLEITATEEECAEDQSVVWENVLDPRLLTTSTA